MSKNLIKTANIRKLNTIVIKDVSAPTDCISREKKSAEGLALMLTMMIMMMICHLFIMTVVQLHFVNVSSPL
jgi:hypothetical protein